MYVFCVITAKIEQLPSRWSLYGFDVITHHVLNFFFIPKVKLREMKPGMLSRELKDALGMPDGAPPPWLINMQVCSFNLNFRCSPIDNASVTG